MKKKFVFISIFILINSFTVVSQAILTGNLYYTNSYYLNPAYAGYNGVLSAQLNFRQTSASIAGAPVIMAIGIHSPVYKNMSLGGRFYQQSEGLFDNLSVLIDYSYHLKLNKTQSLRFGLALGAKSNQMDYSRIIADDPSAIIDIASKSYEGIFLQSAAGIAYNWKLLDLSLSVPQLFETKKTLKPEYCALLSYRIKLKSENISLKPSILMTISKGKPVLYDLNLATYWKNLFYFGFTYRNRPGAIFSAGFNFKDLSLTYAFETGFQKYSNLFNQIHEISITYSFTKKKSIPIDTISNPDFPLIVKNDSLKQDTSIKNIITKKDTSNVDLVNIADSLKTDSLTPGLADNNAKNSSLDNYEIVEIGDGIYSVKYIIEPGDSIQNSVNQDTSLNNNSKVADELMNRILREKIEKTDSLGHSENGFYTIKLFLDETNKYILRDAEIALETWFDTDDNGQFMYYLGHYKTIEEANIRILTLKKYDNLVSEIIRINN